MRLATPDAKFLTDALKRRLDFIFAQDWGLALFGTRIATIAVPDIVTLRVFAVVPDFVPIKAAAVCTNQLIAKGGIIPKPCLVSSPVLQLLLDKVENIWRKIGSCEFSMWYCGNSPSFFPRFLAEIVHCVALLQQSFSLMSGEQGNENGPFRHVAYDAEDGSVLINEGTAANGIRVGTEVTTRTSGSEEWRLIYEYDQQGNLTNYVVNDSGDTVMFYEGTDINRFINVSNYPMQATVIQ